MLCKRLYSLATPYSCSHSGCAPSGLAATGTGAESPRAQSLRDSHRMQLKGLACLQGWEPSRFEMESTFTVRIFRAEVAMRD